MLKQRNVKYVVAPYEADAQLAYLAKTGDTHLTIAEDSDLLLYRCPVVFYKMDHGGAGEEIKLRNLGANEALVISNSRFVLVVTQLKPSHLAHLFAGLFVLDT